MTKIFEEKLCQIMGIGYPQDLIKIVKSMYRFIKIFINILIEFSFFLFPSCFLSFSLFSPISYSQLLPVRQEIRWLCWVTVSNSWYAEANYTKFSLQLLIRLFSVQDRRAVPSHRAPSAGELNSSVPFSGSKISGVLNS